MNANARLRRSAVAAALSATLAASALACTTPDPAPSTNSPASPPSPSVPPPTRTAAAAQTNIELPQHIRCAITEDIVVCTGGQQFTVQRDGSAPYLTHLATLGALAPDHHLAGDTIGSVELQPGDIIQTPGLSAVVTPLPNLTVSDDTGRISSAEGPQASMIRLRPGQPLADIKKTPAGKGQIHGWDISSFSSSGSVLFVPADGVKKTTPALALTITPAAN
ncbi:Uncharacterised protein [Mycobacteroides abscessus]|uniref:Secreted protein n=1 Tax=Mycobacteroides abscessus TaxID=36809 RepID=A0A0U0ZRF1_9MYCO|nr:Uncharacterised protein [Mycobacteroides abscessus]